MRRRRALSQAVASLTLAGLLVATPATAGVESGDGGLGADLAAAQLTIHLLTNTDLRPSDVTCTPPPTLQAGGDLLCFALVATPTGRQTVAAVATLEAPGRYGFTAVTKPAVPAPPTGPVGDDPDAPADPPEQPTDPAGADQAVLDSLAEVTADPEGLQTALAEDEPAVVSVDELTYHAPTGSLIVGITSSVDTPDMRDQLAFYVTDRLALLWEADQPFRNEAATIHPRLEVSVDGVIYGSPFAVMVDVAEFAIDYEEWLAITTTAASPARLADTASWRLRPARSAAPAQQLDARPRPSH